MPILTPDPDASLLVTVYFQEKQGGFLRIIWTGTQGAQLLSDNFYENIAMNNQRSLLISPATLVGDGVLSFQCGDTDLGIQRIKTGMAREQDGPRLARDPRCARHLGDVGRRKCPRT